MNRPAAQTLRFLAPPSESGLDAGTVAAGHVLEWIDRAGFAAATAWSSTYCVTAYVGGVRFARPIRVGDLVEIEARIVLTGRTSMHVRVEVRTADPRGGPTTHALDCLLVFVAIDAERRPVVVPPWSPLSIGELDAAESAGRRIPVRARIRDAMVAAEYTEAGSTPRTVLRFLAAPRDVNYGGAVHGGTVLRWIDEASQVVTGSWTRRRTAAVYAGGIEFVAPIRIGDLVEVEARIIHSTEHSLHVAVHVRSTEPTTLQWRQTTRCMVISVVPEVDGRAAAVPPLALATAEGRALDEHARHLVALRALLEELPVAPAV